MRDVMAKVRDFRRAMGLPVHDDGDNVGRSDLEIAAELVREEAAETLEAFRRTMDPGHPDAAFADDLVDVADGLADLVYVAAGLALVLGIDLAAVFELVHAANMRKGPGPFREDGKKLKPEGWVGPEAKIRELLVESMGLEEGVPAFEPVELGGDKVGPHDTIGDVFPDGIAVHEHDPAMGCDGCPMLSRGFDGPACATLVGLRLLEVDSRSGQPVPPSSCPLLRGRAIVVQGRQ